MSERTRDRICIYVAGVIVVTVFAMALLAAAPLQGQQLPDTLQPPVAFGGVQAQYARPTGEFRGYVKHGGGVNLNVVWPVRRESPLALRGDGGFTCMARRRSACASAARSAAAWSWT